VSRLRGIVRKASTWSKDSEYKGAVTLPRRLFARSPVTWDESERAGSRVRICEAAAGALEASGDRRPVVPDRIASDTGTTDATHSTQSVGTTHETDDGGVDGRRRLVKAPFPETSEGRNRKNAFG